MVAGTLHAKQRRRDPLTGKDVEVMWVKGQWWRSGTLKKSGLAALYMIACLI
jgi:rhamnose utilization protein RhaD (predicted bifunctional aldolase and dehydrogenase)